MWKGTNINGLIRSVVALEFSRRGWETKCWIWILDSKYGNLDLNPISPGYEASLLPTRPQRFEFTDYDDDDDDDDNDDELLQNK